MAKLNWGKCTLYVKDIDQAKTVVRRLPIPVEDSTQLSTEQGDKMEATIEGGEYEDVKYKRSKYTLDFEIRMMTQRYAPFPMIDGVVQDHYCIWLKPEDDDCEGFQIDKASVSVEYSYSAAEGSRWICHCEALKADSGDAVKWGKVTPSGTGASLAIAFQEGSSNEPAGMETGDLPTYPDIKKQ